MCPVAAVSSYDRWRRKLRGGHATSGCDWRRAAAADRAAGKKQVPVEQCARCRRGGRQQLQLAVRRWKGGDCLIVCGWRRGEEDDGTQSHKEPGRIACKCRHGSRGWRSALRVAGRETALIVYCGKATGGFLVASERGRRWERERRGKKSSADYLRGRLRLKKEGVSWQSLFGATRESPQIASGVWNGWQTKGLARASGRRLPPQPPILVP